METSVVTSIITALGSITVALITVVVKNWLDAKRSKADKEREEVIDEAGVEEMVLVQDWLNEFRKKYEFDRVGIFQFHNGGKFFQGKSMKKFSMTYESVAPGYEKIKRAQQNVLASEYPQWISTMLKKKCFANLVSEIDPQSRAELEALGIQQFVTVPIHCLKGALIGFIVGYNIGEIDDAIKNKFVPLVEDSKFVSGYIL
jgi:hypothetical protein